LAAGYVSLELGSDHGGSLRFPAHFCGIYAHRPSLDVIPGRGSSPPAFPASSRRAEPRLGQWAAVGPMARSPRDLCLALDVLAGPDERSDGIAYALTLPPARHRRLADFRILLLENHPLLPTGSAVRAAFEKLSAHIERAGCQISRGGDFLPDLAETTRTFFQFGQAEWISTQSEAELAKLHERIRSFAPGDQTPEALRYRSMPTDLRGWFQTSQRCAALSHQWRKLFASFDVILCPVMPVPAFLHNLDTPRRPLEIDGELHPYFELNKWSAISCLAGLPATAAPIGRSGEGLPIGIQIIGPYLEDRTPLAFAEMLAADYETFTPPPDLGRRIQNHPNNGGP
jgi:amidase